MNLEKEKLQGLFEEAEKALRLSIELFNNTSNKTFIRFNERNYFLFIIEIQKLIMKVLIFFLIL
jgi:hypothetical protein